MSMHWSGSALGDFRLAGMYDGRVCVFAMGGGAIFVEAEGLHRRATHGFG